MYHQQQLLKAGMTIAVLSSLLFIFGCSRHHRNFCGFGDGAHSRAWRRRQHVHRPVDDQVG